MARTFLSYASEDRGLAQRLATLLRARGHEPLYADGIISPGQEWRDVLAESLRSADVAVILITPASSRSKWILAEAGTAIAYSGERGKPIIIPTIFDDAELPGPLSHIQAIFGKESELDVVADRLDEAIHAQLGRQIAVEAKRQEARDVIQGSAATYIQQSLSQLDSRELSLRQLAYVWYTLGFLALGGGVCGAIMRVVYVGSMATTWQSFAHFLVLGLTVVALLVALARYAFLLGKSFMVESLRNADRRHAISLGEFYIKAFPERLDWSVLKEIFQQWNIDKGSAFLRQEAKDFDPELVAKTIELARVIVDREKPKEK